MKTSFGPWTTAIHSSGNIKLSTFWKRRLALLRLTSQSSSAAGRSTILTLTVVALVVVMLPTLSGVRAIADYDQSPAEAQDQPQQAKSLAAPDATASEELKEGWRRTIPIPRPRLGEGHTYVIWVEGGWLQVKRQTATGETDWHIVLARATDPTPPTVLADEDEVPVEFSYRDGRYFIREDRDVLRCIREAKRGEDGTWPRSYFLDDSFKYAGFAGAPSRGQITALRGDTWFFAATGPTKERFDCIVRLVPVKMMPSGYSFSSIRGGLRRIVGGDALIGDASLIDDGEMLVSTRTLEPQYNAYLVKENLPGSPAPALDGTAWLNTEGPLAWDELQGKVVLLDFWGTWCGPCVKKMPDVQALYEKYQDKGLVVIGVHSAQAAETCAEFAEKNNITFPLVLDTGKTVENYASTGFPSYFLIDKTGKVTAAGSNRMPDEKEIERLLSQ